MQAEDRLGIYFPCLHCGGERFKVRRDHISQGVFAKCRECGATQTGIFGSLRPHDVPERVHEEVEEKS